MKRIISSFSAIGILMIVMTGVSHAKDSPREIVKKYLNAVRNNEYDRAYTYIASTDSTIIDWLELIKYVKKISPPKLISIIDVAHSAVKQEILNASVGGDGATVKIKSLIPDMKKILEITSDPEEIKFLLKTGGLPIKNRFGECKLVVENGDWKISRVKGVSSGQAAEITTDLAELVLGVDEAERIKRKIDEFMNVQRRGI